MAKGPGLKGFDAGASNISDAIARRAAATSSTPYRSADTGFVAPNPVYPGGSVIAPPPLQATGLADDGGAAPRTAVPLVSAVTPQPAAPTSFDAAAGGQAPATKVDTSYGPQLDPNQVAGQVSKAWGVPVDSHSLGVTDPGIHNVEDFVAHNSHLTPLDIQILTAGKMPQHDVAMKTVLDSVASTRQVALDAAMKVPAGPARDLALTRAYSESNDAIKPLLIPVLGGASVPGLMQDEMNRRALANKGLPKR